MKMEMKIDSAKGLFGILLAVVIVAGYGAYKFHLRSTLIRDGTALAQKHIENDLIATKMQGASATSTLASEIEQARSFELVSFTPRGFFPGSKASVRVEIVSSAGEQMYYFEFERVLGNWRLRREIPPRLFSW